MNTAIKWKFMPDSRPVVVAQFRVDNNNYSKLIIKDSHSSGECRHICRGYHARQALLDIGIENTNIITMWSTARWDKPDHVIIDIFIILDSYDNFAMAKMVLA